jgi:hypothetical protein
LNGQRDRRRVGAVAGDEVQLGAARDRLVDLYEAWGRADEAQKARVLLVSEGPPASP